MIVHFDFSVFVIFMICLTNISSAFLQASKKIFRYVLLYIKLMKLETQIKLMKHVLIRMQTTGITQPQSLLQIEHIYVTVHIFQEDIYGQLPIARKMNGSKENILICHLIQQFISQLLSGHWVHGIIMLVIFPAKMEWN